MRKSQEAHVKGVSEGICERGGAAMGKGLNKSIQSGESSSSRIVLPRKSKPVIPQNVFPFQMRMALQSNDVAGGLSAHSKKKINLQQQKLKSQRISMNNLKDKNNSTITAKLFDSTLYRQNERNLLH